MRAWTPRRAALFLAALDLAAALAISTGLGTSSIGSANRIRFVAFACFAILPLVVPPVAAASPVNALMLSGAIAGVHAAIVALGGYPFQAAASVAVLALGFAILSIGLAGVAVRVGLSRGSAIALGCLIPFALLTGPFVANPILEHPALASARPALIAGILGVNPLAGAASALGFDWLRADSMYSLSVIGPFYPYHYPGAIPVAARLGIPGILLWGAASIRLGRRASRRDRKIFVEKGLGGQ